MRGEEEGIGGEGQCLCDRICAVYLPDVMQYTHHVSFLDCSKIKSSSVFDTKRFYIVTCMNRTIPTG